MFLVSHGRLFHNGGATMPLWKKRMLKHVSLGFLLNIVQILLAFRGCGENFCIMQEPFELVYTQLHFMLGKLHLFLLEYLLSLLFLYECRSLLISMLIQCIVLLAQLHNYIRVRIFHRVIHCVRQATYSHNPWPKKRMLKHVSLGFLLNIVQILLAFRGSWNNICIYARTVWVGIHTVSLHVRKIASFPSLSSSLSDILCTSSNVFTRRVTKETYA